MSRLIDADALIERIKNIYCKGCDNYHGIRCRACPTDDAIGEIDDAPTIEAEPVRHGHWNGWTATHWTKKCDDRGDPIYTEHTYYACSGCRRRTIIKSAYCPACGRKMDEVSE